MNKQQLACANYNYFIEKVVNHMKKPKQPQNTVKKDDTEFASSITPEINGGRRSRSHQDRFPPDRNRADDLPHLGRKGGAT